MEMETLKLRPPAPSPVQNEGGAPTSIAKVVSIKHPAYPDEYEQNLLLQLYAWDAPTGGLHAGTALLAISIVACNSWDGYLTVERDGERLHLQDDDILPPGEYYFYVNHPTPQPAGVRQPYKYPIYPSFEHWAFPHGHIPARWLGVGGADDGGAVEPSSTPSVSSVTAAVIARDKACVVSKHRDYIERAHLCPRNELDWFQKNGMRRYNARRELSGDFITDDIANAVAMRSDIHRCFDDCKFVFTRKSGQWATHFLETTFELGQKYHNRPAGIPSGASMEFILARFAWAIFPFVKAFMEQGPERLVRVREKCPDGFHEVSKTLEPAGFAQMLDASRGRSASPKKRKASDLPPITEAKRHCEGVGSLDDQASDDNETDSKQYMPSLFSSTNSNNDSSLGVTPLNSPAISSTLDQPQHQSCLDSEENTSIDALRLRELRKRRPINPKLFCCDYTAAELANDLGIAGKPEFGGGHLCMECLGLEFREADGELERTEGEPTYPK